MERHWCLVGFEWHRDVFDCDEDLYYDCNVRHGNTSCVLSLEVGE